MSSCQVRRQRAAGGNGDGEFKEEVETRGQMAWRNEERGRSQVRVQKMQMKEDRDRAWRMGVKD